MREQTKPAVLREIPGINVINTLASFRLLRGYHRTASTRAHATVEAVLGVGVTDPLFPRLLCMYVLLSILPLLLMIGALADIITMDPSRVKHLPKFAWIILVILIPLVGSILWFAVGREYVQAADRGSFGDPRRREQSAGSGGPDAGGRMSRDTFAGGRFSGGTASGDTEAQLAALNREIAAHERAERIRHLEEELEEKRHNKDTES